MKNMEKELMEIDSEILDDVNAINEMIDKEKSNQEKMERKTKEKVTTEKESVKLVSSISKEPKKDIVVEEKKLERLHLRVMGDSIDVLYRPNHCYVAFLPNDENGKAEVKRLASLSRDDFKKYLASSRMFSFPTKSVVDKLSNTHEEEWYKGAWSMTTKNLLKEIGIENPIEIPIYKGE